MQRYFAKAKIDKEFILEDSDLRHINLVMRMKDNDEIIVVYENVAYLSYLKDQKIIEKEVLNGLNKDMPEVTLIIPVLKEQKMDYIIQKATELGVSRIIPYYSTRGVVKENNKDKTDRWNKIAKEASEQSHRNDIPIILKPEKLENLNLEGINLICDTTEESTNIRNVLKTINIYDKINVVIGPEGGFTNQELDILKNKNYQAITLGSRILRVETVPLFIMSVINYEIME